MHNAWLWVAFCHISDAIETLGRRPCLNGNGTKTGKAKTPSKCRVFGGKVALLFSQNKDGARTDF
jgi:hypothetical protein